MFKLMQLPRAWTTTPKEPLSETIRGACQACGFWRVVQATHAFDKAFGANELDCIYSARIRIVDHDLPELTGWHGVRVFGFFLGIHKFAALEP